MGSGKSTVGALLAAELGWAFADLDHAIEARTGETISQTFATRGEAYFREVESAALGDLLEREQTVIALGGGAPEIAANRNALAADEATRVVVLEAPFTELYERCIAQSLQAGTAVRPVLANKDEAEARFYRRAPHYRAIAHEVLETASLDPTTTVAHVIERLGLAKR